MVGKGKELEVVERRVRRRRRGVEEELRQTNGKGATFSFEHSTNLLDLITFLNSKFIFPLDSLKRYSHFFLQVD